MMVKRKLSLTELSEKVDLTIKAKGVRFETPDAICKTLNCQPGDILEYLNEKDFKKIDGMASALEIAGFWSTHKAHMRHGGEKI
jgi:putative transcriptional regulator